MDEIIARIKAYVLVLNTSLVDDDYLDLIIDIVVDRALIYMNRDQLVDQYEEDIVDYPITDKSDTTETWYEYWKYYDAYPIPPKLEKVIATVVNGTYRTTVAQEDATTNSITEIKDQGQSIKYSEKAINYLNSSNDSEIFMGMRTMLDNYRIGTVIEDPDYEYIKKPF